jgi:hypothetical protein
LLYRQFEIQKANILGLFRVTDYVYSAFGAAGTLEWIFFEVEEYPDPGAFLSILRSPSLSAQRSAKNEQLTTERNVTTKR